MNYTLSICIPTYNRAALLEKTIRSVIDQIDPTFNVQLVISDNASNDETASVAENAKKLYPHVAYYRNNENVGYDGNVVACITHSSGEFTWLVSDDDIVLPGTLSRVQKEINRHSPSIICLSHYGFDGDAPNILRRVYYPENDIVFTDGIGFFQHAGLGFLSSLIMKTSMAKDFISKVRPWKGCAHLDIAARIALTRPGPFLFLGTCPVAARMPDTPPVGYDLMLYGYLYVNELYRELAHEGLLPDKIVRRRESSLLRSEIPRYVLFQKVLGDFAKVRSHRGAMRDQFGHHWEYTVLVLPLFYLPSLFLRVPYKIARRTARYIRNIRYNILKK